MLMENDFRGYGYGSTTKAITVLTSHEMFHGVEAAYSDDIPVWMSEGMATWAEYQYAPAETKRDVVHLCSAYLEDAGRSLDSPPAGTVTGFSYGTAIFFQFLTEHLDDSIGPMVLDSMVGRSADDAVDALIETVESLDTEMSDEWHTFAQWNLATGDRAGVAESYLFAASLGGVEAETEGDSILDDNRFYPLATSYFRVDHAGGEMSFASLEDMTGLRFSVLPVADGSADGPVGEPIAEWEPSTGGRVDFGEVGAGGYWLVGTYPEVGAASIKAEFCFGLDVSGCEEAVETDSKDETDGKGFGCATAPNESSGSTSLSYYWLLSFAGVFIRNRRQKSTAANQ